MTNTPRQYKTTSPCSDTQVNMTDSNTEATNAKSRDEKIMP